ncbi:hypothetical protein PAV_4c04170 [Paenibacillus alvei DSM 29]|nr:hypothetical protein PAV_4c04170 [Paenibacillus alvei DSM 29]
MFTWVIDDRTVTREMDTQKQIQMLSTYRRRKYPSLHLLSQYRTISVDIKEDDS